MIIVEIGWDTKIVMSKEDAMAFVGILERAENYKEVWRKDEEGGTTYHVFPRTEMPSLKVMSNDMYKIAKLAGKPESM